MEYVYLRERETDRIIGLVIGCTDYTIEELCSRFDVTEAKIIKNNWYFDLHF